MLFGELELGYITKKTDRRSRNAPLRAMLHGKRDEGPRPLLQTIPLLSVSKKCRKNWCGHLGILKE
jgi:hypothetical protein